MADAAGHKEKKVKRLLKRNKKNQKKKGKTRETTRLLSYTAAVGDKSTALPLGSVRQHSRTKESLKSWGKGLRKKKERKEKTDKKKGGTSNEKQKKKDQTSISQGQTATHLHTAQRIGRESHRARRAPPQVAAEQQCRRLGRDVERRMGGDT